MKLGAEINRDETAVKKINEIKSCFFEKISKINTSLIRLTTKKKTGGSNKAEVKEETLQLIPQKS